MSELSLEDDFRPQRFGRANRGRSFSDDSLTSSEDGLSDYEVSRPSQVNLRNRAGSFTSNAEAPISAYQYDGLESEFDRGSSYVGPRPQRRPTVYQAPHYGGPESEFDRGSSYVGSRPQRRPTVYQARDSESHSESGSSEFDDAASMQGMPGDGPMGEIEPAPVEEAQQQEAPNEQVVPEPQPGGIALPSSRQSLIDDESLSRASNAGEERGLRPVGVDREMVPAQFGVDVQTGPVPGSSAGVGKLGGGRGKWNHATKNPLFMFPKRAYTAIKALSVGIGKLVKRGWKRLFGKKKAEAADANAVDANAAPAQGAEVEGAEVEGAEVEGAEVNAGPTIEVDESTAYGKRMIAKEQAREQFSDYQARNPDGAIPGEVPQGWTDTKFGSANSLLTRLRAGDTTTEAERDYMHAMNAKAMAITKQREEASPENPSAFPFAQKTQADAEDTGVAKAGHFVTATGAAINDREEMRPDEGTNAAGAKAWDALNIGTNAIKAGTKFVDRQIKNYADKDYDEKVLGGAGKAYLETGKAAQFTYGFVGKDIAKGVDAWHGGRAGSDLTKELDPYLGIKNYDRVAQTNVELLSGKPGLMYSKNFNAGSAGKYVENVANVAQAAGTGLTEMFGKPFEKMHAKRGELLSDQFVTTVARRKLQAERANRDRLIDDHVDPERQGVPTFLNANAEMLQAGAREYRSAQQLGKQAQQEGYASNFGLDMDTTAMLNDMKHRRRHGAAFNTAMNAKRAAEANIAEKTALDAARGTDDEQKVKEEAALDYATYKRLKTDVRLVGQDIVTRDGDAAGRAVVGFFFSLSLFMLLIVYGMHVMRGVIEEKSNRIVEVIVRAVRPSELMAGKILGIGAVGFTQYLAYVVLGTLATTLGGPLLESSGLLTPGGLGGSTPIPVDAATFLAGSEELAFLLDVNWPLMIGATAFFFVAGFALYASLFAAVGSLVDTESDAQYLMLPAFLPLMASYLLAVFAMQDPEGTVAYVASFVPFTAPVLMLIRIPVGVPLHEVLISGAGVVVTAWLCILGAGRIYRTGIFMYGKRPTLREAFRWLRKG